MAHDVFISYSSKDKPVADAVRAGLEGSIEIDAGQFKFKIPHLR
jgi:hypothetical protein